ncbi:MAG: imidazole glycerol phosphate synthase subunit HisH [Actinobacteria bacterium]|nr:imidazole glycerol phosphate synthase subunit HisH [Actinomycetota bacterium]
MIKKSRIKISIIDYGLSNLFSVKHALQFLGYYSKITMDKREVDNSDIAILPGVGSFGEAMKNLAKMDLVEAIKKFIRSGKPFLGICLGMQLLFSESEEINLQKGMNILKGRVVKFPPKNYLNQTIKIPQIGWNRILKKTRDWSNTPLNNIKDGEYMYFVHSYYVKPADQTIVLSLTNYMKFNYCSSILYKNIFAVQFHPEKSAREGITIYNNFLTKAIV